MRLASKISTCGLCLGGMLVLLAISGSAASAQSLDDEKRIKSLTSYTMGVIYDLEGDTEKAINEFEKSLSLQDNYAAHLRLGSDYARLGLLPRAIKELKQVLEFDEHNIQARYLLALIYSTQKDFDKAAQEYEAILTSFSQVEPENIEIYGYLAQLYYSQKEYEKAIQQFEIILSLDKTNVDIMFLLGCLYLETNQKDKAIDIFSRAIIIDPQHDTSLNSLGYLYAESGENLEQAQQLIQKAIDLDPKNGAYLDSMGWVFYKKGDYAQALQYLKQADSLIKDPVIYEHLGDVYLKLNEPQEAKKYWKQSLELLPDQAEIIKKLDSVQ